MLDRILAVTATDGKMNSGYVAAILLVPILLLSKVLMLVKIIE
jgi:hypothetical protein